MENNTVNAGEKSKSANTKTMAPVKPTTIPTQLKYLAEACKCACLNVRLPTGI